MEFKLNVLSIMVYLCLTSLASSLKYEHISDCYFYDRGTTPGENNVTFVCAAHDNENTVFVDSQNFKCIKAYAFKWPGTIDFRDCRFPTMSRNYFEMFYNMHTFIISDVYLETMQLDIFRKATNVSTLDISQNQLTEIPSLIFFNAIKLEHVDFSENIIEKIDSMAFEGVTNIESFE